MNFVEDDEEREYRDALFETGRRHGLAGIHPTNDELAYMTGYVVGEEQREAKDDDSD